ncbi:hypothetical protein SAMN05660493_01558 [Epilithonimonas bovis DSM 19482]|uniref:Bacterial mobilisation domain-containing protein n=2 Tax=Epilithonimonas TaxID=2782229 RepID=A0A1U7PY07_9FLAO|nr:hypothetical protein SAMN05660493_01558 [Epilithonimonas bovis DSM 19482]
MFHICVIILVMDKTPDRIRIEIRIERERKKNWKKLCSERNVSLTSLIIDSVENRLMHDERRKILAFIEKQDNIFVKIETNINQIAKIANTNKSMSPNEITKFSEKLVEIEKLKIEQNKLFSMIHSLLSR